MFATLDVFRTFDFAFSCIWITDCWCTTLLTTLKFNVNLSSKIRVALIKAKKKVSLLHDDPIETGNTVRRESPDELAAQCYLSWLLWCSVSKHLSTLPKFG